MLYPYITQTKFNVRISILEEKYNSKKGASTSLEKEFNEDGEHVKKERAEKEALKRAKRMVVDYAMCNDFEYFGTFTFSDKLVNVHSAEGQVQALDKVLDFLNNYKRNNPNLQYILVPEYGSKKRRLHFHFIMSGINNDDLFINENKKLDFLPYRLRFGWCQIAKIGNKKVDKQASAKYISKYITKDSLQLRSHRYFCSQNLKKPVKYCLDDYAFTYDIQQWLEEFGVKPYFQDDKKKVKCFELPMRMFKDMCKAIDGLFFNGKILLMSKGFRCCYDPNPFEEVSFITSCKTVEYVQVAL